MESNNGEKREMPTLASLLVLVGILDIIGGIVLCVVLWTGEPTLGYEWLATAYIPSITWLASGLVSGLVFFVAAAILTYLRDIRGSLGEISSGLRSVSRHEEARGETSAGSRSGSSREAHSGSSLRVRAAFDRILLDAIESDMRFDWSTLRRSMPEPRPTEPEAEPMPPRPVRVRPGVEPRARDPEYQAVATLKDIVSVKQWKRKVAEAEERFERAHKDWEQTKAETQTYRQRLEQWEKEVETVKAANEDRKAKHNEEMTHWNERMKAFQAMEDDRLNALRRLYNEGQPEGIRALAEAALRSPGYPKELNRQIAVDYTPSTRTLIARVTLPSAEELTLPSPRSFQHWPRGASEGGIGSCSLEEFAAQLSLRSIHEILSADDRGHIDSVQLTLWMRWFNPATGSSEDRALVDVSTKRDQFSALKLARVDARRCLEWLGAEVPLAD